MSNFSDFVKIHQNASGADDTAVLEALTDWIESTFGGKYPTKPYYEAMDAVVNACDIGPQAGM